MDAPEARDRRRRPPSESWLLVFACGFWLGNVFHPWSAVQAQPVVQVHPNTRVFEIRTYTASEGKLQALHARFRDHTVALFQKHDITSVGYFMPQDPPLKQNTLVYILAHPSREAAANWQAFRDDRSGRIGSGARRRRSSCHASCYPLR